MVHIPYIQPKRKKKPKEYKSPIVWWNSVRLNDGELSCQLKNQERPSPVTTNQSEPQGIQKNPMLSLQDRAGKKN